MCSEAGGAYIPIDGGCPVERAAYMLRESATRCLISERNMLDKLRRLQPQCPDLETIYLVDADESDDGANQEGGWWDRRALTEYSADDLPERSGPENLAYLIYTSGTSGRPKGVMIEHRAVLRLVCNTNYITVRDDDGFLQTGSLAFDASTFEIWGAPERRPSLPADNP